MADPNTDSIARLFRPEIQAMQPYIPGEQPQGGKFIKLNTNENPYPPSPKVIAAIQEAAAASWNAIRIHWAPRSEFVRRKFSASSRIGFCVATAAMTS